MARVELKDVLDLLHSEKIRLFQDETMIYEGSSGLLPYETVSHILNERVNQISVDIDNNCEPVIDIYVG